MNKRASGFTLLEILVACTVFILLVATLLGISSQMGSMSRILQANTERLERAGVVFDMLRRDLAAAQPPLVSKANTGLQFLLNPDSSAVPAILQNPSAFFWQAPVSPDITQGDMAALGYFLRWDTTTASQPKALLCRLEILPNDTANYLIYSGQPWLSPAILAAKASGAPADNYAGYITDGVIALWARAFDASGQPFYTWDSRSTGRLPTSLEVAIVVLDNHSIARLTAVPAYTYANPANFDAEIASFVAHLPSSIKPGARVYRTTFPLRNAPITPVSP